MSIVVVSSSAALLKALSSAHAGDTIKLAPGSYTNVTLYNIHFSSPVTITSESSTSPAQISGLAITNSSGLSLTGLHLSPTSTANAYAARVLNSTNISLSNSDFSGSATASLTSRGSGVLIENSSHVSVQNSHFEYLNIGIADVKNSYVQISGNAFDHLVGDGIDNQGSSYVTIANNNFTDFQANIGGAHPDCIQFFTSGTTTAAHDISVTGNVYARGSGVDVQGIFMTDQVGTLAYKNVTVSDNILLGGLWDGIDIDHATGSVVVTNNTVASWAGTDTNTGATLGNLISRIMLSDVTGATVTETGNTTQNYILGSQTIHALSGNSALGSITDNGASLLRTWASTHSTQLTSFSSDFLSLLGTTSTLHSTVGLSGQ